MPQPISCGSEVMGSRNHGDDLNGKDREERDMNVYICVKVSLYWE